MPLAPPPSMLAHTRRARANHWIDQAAPGQTLGGDRHGEPAANRGRSLGAACIRCRPGDGAAGDARRQRDRDQGRPDGAVQRAGERLRQDRDRRGRLRQDDQRAGRGERPQDQPDPARRRLQPAENHRAGAQADRAGAGGDPVPDDRHGAEHRHPQIHQPEEGAEHLARLGRVDLRRSEGLPLEHPVPAELPDRGSDVRRSTS